MLRPPLARLNKDGPAVPKPDSAGVLGQPLGFRVEGLDFRVWGLGSKRSRIQGLAGGGEALSEKCYET